MKIGKYYTAYIIWGIIYMIIATLSPYEYRTDIKGLILFPLTAVLTCITRIHYVRVLLQRMKKSDLLAYEIARDTINSTTIKIDPNYHYNEQTKDDIDGFKAYTWFTLGYLFFAVAMIII